MDYEILMDWIERGILTVSPSPQTIAGYLVNYIHTTPVLEKRDITINEHIWYLFEYDCGQNWHANPAKGYPYYTFQHFTENGKLDRMRVLKESFAGNQPELQQEPVQLVCRYVYGTQSQR